jgi:hypothetical protein
MFAGDRQGRVFLVRHELLNFQTPCPIAQI